MGFQAASHASIADLFSNYKYQQTFGLLYLNRKKADITDVRSVLNELVIENSDVKCVQQDTEKWYSRLLIATRYGLGPFRPEIVYIMFGRA